MSESLAHRFSKQAFASWVRGRSRVGINFKGLQPVLPYIPISSNKPMYGVYEEYPVCVDETGELVGLESNSCLTGWHDWTKQHGKIASKGHQIPSSKDIKKWNASHHPRLKMKWFFDIGVVDENGRLSCVFEIKHTHASTDQKIAWLEENNVKWFEVSADWILNRVRAPFDISGCILRPWDSDNSCKSCKSERKEIVTTKLGRGLCHDCIDIKNIEFCHHPDCSEVTIENTRRCAIHARLDK